MRGSGVDENEIDSGTFYPVVLFFSFINMLHK